MSRNLELKNSKIKGYVFHGSGCNFKFKHENFDIEFENDNIGFTGWSYYCFAKNVNSEITEMEINNFLCTKVNEQKLKFTGKIYNIKG